MSILIATLVISASGCIQGGTRYEFSGSGDGTTPNFHLEAGNAIFLFKYAGGPQDFVTFRLLDASEKQWFSSSYTGGYTPAPGGDTVKIVNAGDYHFNVSTLKNWSITITQ